MFNIKTQYRSYRDAIDNLKSDEIVLHIDFSENYSCKCFEKVQCHHFGGSRKQFTLNALQIKGSDWFRYSDSETFFHTLRNSSKVRLYLVTDNDIENVEKTVPKNVVHSRVLCRFIKFSLILPGELNIETS
ncbi:unnamed protein product [Acanthoscelides obtectus]|uniref:Uncharacterized protein n=1 Tax=Acanthoscelides obtectus TaxID=200917 RepID=A0A9P0MAS8_ACAOB|nr:unnamed protein product [Acanthoscelides obtectus]CAK1620733.1 hypothetical protein AOBTE_LOCUS530 [Acanthoscelides obtectus]